MVQQAHSCSPERRVLIRWIACLGAVTAEALAERAGMSVASARAQLGLAKRARLLSRRRPLAGHPALYTVTRKGLAASGLRGLDPGRVSASNARHLIVCAEVAAALEYCYPDHRVAGERELRRDERESGVPLASACLGVSPDGVRLLHRPDLALWPNTPDPGLPVAVEVELTVKAPRRLADICRAWARCRCVAGVIYLVTPEVEHAVIRAVDAVHAGDRIAVVPLHALPGLGRRGAAGEKRPR